MQHLKEKAKKDKKKVVPDPKQKNEDRVKRRRNQRVDDVDANGHEDAPLQPIEEILLDVDDQAQWTDMPTYNSIQSI